MTARGLRNNNPGNIEIGAPWQGLMPREQMSPAQKREKRFCVFVTPAYGIRAIARTLITYQDKRRAKDGSKIDTVQEIIERWAPSNENDTRSYARAVRRALDLAVGEKIDVHDYGTLRPLIEAIIQHENGEQPYAPEVIDEGLKLAGVEPPRKPVARPLAATRTAKGGAAIATGTAVSTAAEAVAEQADKIGEAGRAIVDYAPLAGLALILLGLGIVIYARWDDRRRGIR